MAYVREWSDFAYSVTRNPDSSESRVIRAALPYLSTAGHSPIEIARSINAKLDDVVKAIDKLEGFSLVASLPSGSATSASSSYAGKLYYLTEQGWEFRRALSELLQPSA